MNSRYYGILGVPKTVTPDDFRKTYERAVVEKHPEKDGDPQKFKDLAYAFEVLSDPEKREIYDQYGEDAHKEGTGGRGRVDGSMHDA